MLIGNKYKIEAEAPNVILYRKRTTKKDNATRWQAIAYFSTPKNALEYMADLEVNGTGLKDLKTVIEKQEELKKLISGLGRNIEPSLERARPCLKPSKQKSRQLILGKAFTP
jgi:hypothetical protein